MNQLFQIHYLSPWRVNRSTLYLGSVYIRHMKKNYWLKTSFYLCSFLWKTKPPWSGARLNCYMLTPIELKWKCSRETGRWSLCPDCPSDCGCQLRSWVCSSVNWGLELAPCSAVGLCWSLGDETQDWGVAAGVSLVPDDREMVGLGYRERLGANGARTKLLLTVDNFFLGKGLKQKLEH